MFGIGLMYEVSLVIMWDTRLGGESPLWSDILFAWDKYRITNYTTDRAKHTRSGANIPC